MTLDTLDTLDLTELRDALEALDRELIDVLARRMALVVPIAEAKLDAASPFRDGPREQVVFDRVKALARDKDLDENRIEALYRVLLDWSVARQQGWVHERPDKPLKVVYQGVEGCYTHLAAQGRYAHRAGGALLAGCSTFREAAEAVRAREAHLALLPIENTTAGSITQTYDLLAEGGLTITAEVVQHIRHCLLALPGTDIPSLTTVHSHPQALRQCERFFREHDHLSPIEAFDTAGAARAIRDSGDRRRAAIASEAAARHYGLAILARDIQTQTGNYTRFVEVAPDASTAPADASAESTFKSSVIMELSHQPGALARVLAAFSAHRVDLTKLESRPIVGEPWRYRFYLDVAGHHLSEPVGRALDAARADCHVLRVLGSYPAARRDVADPGPNT